MTNISPEKSTSNTLEGVVIEYETTKDTLFAQLYPEESALIEKSSSLSRRLLFAAGRIAARRACSQIDSKLSSFAILRGESNEPLFPPHIRGSISHSNNVACSAVTQDSSIIGLGVDLEPRARTLSQPVIERISSATEKECYAGLGEMNKTLWIKVFSAKEAIFKALFPYIRRDFSFHDLSILFKSESNAVVHCSERLSERLKQSAPKRSELALHLLEQRNMVVCIALLKKI